MLRAYPTSFDTVSLTTRFHPQMQFPKANAIPDNSRRGGGGSRCGFPGRWAPELSGIAFGGESEYASSG